MKDYVIGTGRGARIEDGVLRFVDYDNTVTALEPILLDVELTEEEFLMDMVEESFDMDMDTAIVVNHIGGDPYDGEYTITPKVTEQTLPTRAKTMRDDVTVLEIPYVSVSNLSGGNTVTIGGI